MTADDVKVGQIVTVLEWYCNRSRQGWVEPEPTFASMFSRSSEPSGQRRDYMGAVLRVEAVSLPYVALTKAFSGEAITLDLRLCEIVMLNPDFVALMQAKYEEAMANGGNRPRLRENLFAKWAESMYGRSYSAPFIAGIQDVTTSDDPISDDDEDDDEEDAA